MSPPVDVIHVDEPDWIWLDVDGKVEEVAHGVYEGLDKDDGARDLVQIYVVVERKNLGQAKSSKSGDGLPKNEDENENAVDKERFSAGSRDHVEEIWSTSER